MRGDICTFLEYIYESVAETLPDFRDELGSGAGVQIHLEDPYSLEMQNQNAKKRNIEEPLEDVDARPKAKPRKHRGQVEINLSRSHLEERWLPPGSMKEYYEQYCAQSGLQKPASFASFWRVLWMFAGTSMLFQDMLGLQNILSNLDFIVQISIVISS